MTTPNVQAPGAGRLTSQIARLALSGTAVMVAGTVVATAGAYLFQLLGARALGPVAFAPITVLWTIQFLIITVVMVPIEQLVIRQLELTGGREAAFRRIAGALAVALIAAVCCVVVTAAALRERLFGGDIAYVVLAALLVAGYSVFASARGFLAGRHRYHAYGIATAAESMARLLLAAVVLIITSEGVPLGWVMVLAPLGVLVVRPFSARAAPAAAEDDSASVPVGVIDGGGRFLAPLVLANAASQIVLGVGPIVVGVLGAPPAVVSAVFVTFIVFRAPLWMVQSVLARVLPPFTALAARGEAAALQAWARGLAFAGLGLAAIAAPLGWWVGPEVVGLLFGSTFAPSAPLASLVACGTALAAITLFSAQILVASGRTGSLCAAWLGGLMIAVVTLLVPQGPEIRVGLAFLAGEATALAIVTATTCRAR